MSPSNRALHTIATTELRKAHAYLKSANDALFEQEKRAALIELQKMSDHVARFSAIADYLGIEPIHYHMLPLTCEGLDSIMILINNRLTSLSSSH